MIDQDHKNKFEKVWDKGNYRLGSTAQRMVPIILANIPEGVTINDYGCGTGRAEVEIFQQRPAQKINMIDIAENALETSALKILTNPGSPLSFILADLTDLSAVPHSEWGICINVLMTVQPDKLDMILSEIRGTCDNLIMEVYNLSDVRCEIEMTTIKQDFLWWDDKLREYWPNVEFIQSKEHRQRFIFICRSEL